MPISIVPTPSRPITAYGSKKKQKRRRKKEGKRINLTTRTKIKTGYGDKLVSKQYGGKVQ